jgi:DNA-directed RNA polymerase specialized sigma54-like protein
MIQSMEVLLLPIAALRERIQQELQENPVLELKDAGEDRPQALDGEGLGPAGSTAAEEASDPGSAELVVPEILVERTEEGEYTVRLLDDWLSSICIGRRYVDLYREKGADPKTKE